MMTWLDEIDEGHLGANNPSVWHMCERMSTALRLLVEVGVVARLDCDYREIGWEFEDFVEHWIKIQDALANALANPDVEALIGGER